VRRGGEMLERTKKKGKTGEKKRKRWNGMKKEKKAERAVNLTFDRVRRSVYSIW
jgi:hypothetical protein